MKNRKSIIKISILVISILLLSFSVTYAFLVPNIEKPEITNINVSSKSVDTLTFSNGTPLSLSGDFSMDSALGGTESKTITTNVSATLVANNKTNTASSTYNGYIIFSENFCYGAVNCTLKIFDPSGTQLTSVGTLDSPLPGLSMNGSVFYNYPAEALGFSNYTGIIKFASDYPISTSSSTTGTTQTWTISITIHNSGSSYDDYDEINSAEKLNGSVLLTTKDLTLKDVILASVGGASAIEAKTTAENFNFTNPAATALNRLKYDSTEDGPSDNDIVYYSDSYQYSDGYFNLVNPQSCTYSSCYSSLAGKYILFSSDSQYTPSRTRKLKQFLIGSQQGSNVAIYKSSSRESYDTYDTGIFALTDNDGTSYFYRGAVNYNWVRFNNMMWRIVRINGDGSIRLQYVATVSQISSHGSELDDKARIVGFRHDDNMLSSYGSTISEYSNSMVKASVDAWYTNNMSNVDDLIVTGTYCANGYSNNNFNLTCNSPYTLKVGLLSLREYVASGNPSRANRNLDSNYLSPFLVHEYWLMPNESDLSSLACASGTTNGCDISDSSVMFRPVINVKPNIIVDGGSGQIYDPYDLGTSLVN